MVILLHGRPLNFSCLQLKINVEYALCIHRHLSFFPGLQRLQIIFVKLTPVGSGSAGALLIVLLLVAATAGLIDGDDELLSSDAAVRSEDW